MTCGAVAWATGHEMLPEFGLINMNGRLYDPVIGRFLSPDNYVQAPDFTQSFNRYSYCLNNPLKYNDPSGELCDFIAYTIISVASSMMRAHYDGKNIWKAGAISLASSVAPVVTYGIGQYFGAPGSFVHELLRAGAHGLSSGLISMLNGEKFGSGFLSGAAAPVGAQAHSGV